MKEIAFTAAIAVLLFGYGCGQDSETQRGSVRAQRSSGPVSIAEVPVEASSQMPDLQAELLDDRNKTTNSPIASFDFKNFTYPLPRGWQNPDGSDLTLTDGRVIPVARFVSEDMEDEEKIEARATRRIGMSYVTTKYLDVTGDGQDEAIVVLKVETTGAAIPQLVYVYEWKDGAPQLLWKFRTGDRADGGLKDMRVEDGELVVELFGQDRFLLGETETGKITGDEEQLCCPTYFTRTAYKWNGRDFLLQRKRLTYSVADPDAVPLVNHGDVVNAQNQKK
jgi:glutathione peroxidase-family protein